MRIQFRGKADPDDGRPRLGRRAKAAVVAGLVVAVLAEGAGLMTAASKCDSVVDADDAQAVVAQEAAEAEGADEETPADDDEAASEQAGEGDAAAQDDGEDSTAEGEETSGSAPSSTGTTGSEPSASSGGSSPKSTSGTGSSSNSSSSSGSSSSESSGSPSSSASGASPTSGADSSSAGSSDSGSATTAHEHTWVAVYTTVERTVADGEYIACSDGTTFDDLASAEAHMREVTLAGGSISYSVKTRYATVTEEVVDHYECTSCGATK